MPLYESSNYLKETVVKHPDRAEAERTWNFPYAAIEVHRKLGPGLLESVYETANKIGYLLNFGGEVMRTGITRCVNGLPK
jgi:hypothetical protein